MIQPEPLFPYGKHVKLLVYQHKHFVSYLTRVRSNLIELSTIKECSINYLCKYSLTLYLLMLKKPKLMIKLITFMQGSLQKSKLKTFIDKLNICNPQTLNTLIIPLLQMWLQELTLKEKAFKPYWTPAYKELSEKLLLPTVIDFVDSDLNYYNSLLNEVMVKSSSLTIQLTKPLNKSLPKTYFQLSTSTPVEKWENDDTSIVKALKLKLKINDTTKNIINDWLNTSNYVYNKTVAEIKKRKDNVNFIKLRDMFVTNNTKKNNPEYKEITNKLMELNKSKFNYKKNTVEYNNIIKQINDEKQKLANIIKTLPSEKNTNVKEWELMTPKDIRAGSVKEVCNAHKTAITNLMNGNIKHFTLSYRKKTSSNKSIVIPKTMVKIKDGVITIAPTYLNEYAKIKMGKRDKKKYKNLIIKNDCKIVKDNNEFYLMVPLVSDKIRVPLNNTRYCGIDPGERTFMTSFSNKGCCEYEHNNKVIEILNKKIDRYKNKKFNKPNKKRSRKSNIRRLEKRKENIINEIHWKTILHLLKENDYLFYGDIKSHDIVGKSKNHKLNRNLMNLRLYKFKQRLLFKANEKGKKVFVINESYTTKTCSFCGTMNNPGCSKVYSCSNCKIKMGRDVNASKNILMKGILSLSL